MDKEGFAKLNAAREKKVCLLSPIHATLRRVHSNNSIRQWRRSRPLGVVFYGTGQVDGAELEKHSDLFPWLKKLGLPATEKWWNAIRSKKRSRPSANSTRCGTISPIKQMARW